jgi:hypothetical protein
MYALPCGLSIKTNKHQYRWNYFAGRTHLQFAFNHYVEFDNGSFEGRETLSLVSQQLR